MHGFSNQDYIKTISNFKIMIFHNLIIVVADVAHNEQHLFPQYIQNMYNTVLYTLHRHLKQPEVLKIEVKLIMHFNPFLHICASALEDSMAEEPFAYKEHFPLVSHCFQFCSLTSFPFIEIFHSYAELFSK